MPDVLLLDEPTNHLDDEAAAYLRDILFKWYGPVLIASHDRAFLNDVVTSLVDLDPAPLPQAIAGSLVGDGDGTGIGVTRFSGSFTDYFLARLAARERWEHQYREEQAHLKRLRSAAPDNYIVGHENWSPRSESRVTAKFYADRNAKTVSRRVNDAKARLDELEERQIRKPPREIHFQGLTAASTPSNAERDFQGWVINVSEGAFEGRLKPTSLVIGAGEKWLITGANGSGKSTLLHLLAGRLVPTSGTVTTSSSLRVGLLTQNVDLSDPERRGPDRTTRQVYADLVGPDHAASVPLRTFRSNPATGRKPAGESPQHRSAAPSRPGRTYRQPAPSPIAG
jgi:macrolide transport system ATP-binding/permease protein